MRGKVKASTLTDIANAIRYQSGGSATMTPAELGPAVAALDSSADVPGQQRTCPVDGEGMVSDACLASVADALREQTGEEKTYLPSEMAPAILALSWREEPSLKAMLDAYGGLHIGFQEGHSTVYGEPEYWWEVPPGGYSDIHDVGWDEHRGEIKNVRIMPSVVDAGVTSCAYWFQNCANLRYVHGFDNLVGVRDVSFMFAGCTLLGSIYGSSFDPSTITKSTLLFGGCPSLVGSYDGFVPSDTTGASALKLGANGVLATTNSRTEVYVYRYTDGTASVSYYNSPLSDKEIADSRVIYAEARYVNDGFMPWDTTTRALITRVEFESWMTCIPRLNMDAWFRGLTALTSVVGLAYVKPGEMRYTFGNCTALETLDMRGMDISGMVNTSFAFNGCSKLKTILASGNWSLPTAASGSSTFAGCSSLRGGNGTAWANTRTSGTYFRIDKSGQMGYLTSA